MGKGKYLILIYIYHLLQATRGSSAARMGISKVPRHVALAFIRRTLARNRKFIDTGKSCFSEPALRDVLFAVPSSTSGVPAEQNMRLDPGASGTGIKYTYANSFTV